MRDYQLDSTVTLLRNFADLPFDAAVNAETAQRVNERVGTVLGRMQDTYSYQPLANVQSDLRDGLKRRRLLPAQIDAQAADVYLCKERVQCVLASGEDHVAVSSFASGGDVLAALHDCRRIEEELKNTAPLAFSEAFGYLTARPYDSGGGIRASQLLHLPMTQLLKKGEQLVKLAAGKGCVLSPAQPGAGMFLLENRTGQPHEEEALERLSFCAQEICTLESTWRDEAREKANPVAEDKVYRAYAAASYARIVKREELLVLWSCLTLGYSLGFALCTPAQLEKIWYMNGKGEREIVSAAHAEGIAPDVLRAARLREVIDGGI